MVWVSGLAVLTGLAGAAIFHKAIRRAMDGLVLIPAVGLAYIGWVMVAPRHVEPTVVAGIKWGVLAALLYAFWRYRKVRRRS